MMPIIVQAEPSPLPPPVQLDAVEVFGRRGAARVAPEQVLSPDEIDALGAYDIAVVIARLSERLGLQQPPVIIVNGRPVVDARNFTGFPPDALVRVETLPPQAGALYGDPSRRVVNIVLQPAFESRDAQAKLARPSAGGTSSVAAEGRQSRIEDNETFQIGAQISRTTALRASERSATGRSASADETDTLRPEVQVASVSVSATGAIGDWATSFSSTAQRQSDAFTSSLAGQARETRQIANSLTAAGGVSGRLLDWSVRAGVDGLVAETRQSGLTTFATRTQVFSASVFADRPIMDLPAGPVLVTADARYTASTSETLDAPETTAQTLQTLALGSNLNLPILSRSSERSGPWGDLAVNLGGRLNRQDDAGANGGLNAGLAWSPFSKLRLSAQWSQATDAPTREQRSAPLQYGAPRLVYDFTSGQAVEITPLLGGNPDLATQTARTGSLSASTGPFGAWQLQGNLEFQTVRTANAIGALPTLTPAVEAAFPDRVFRDAEGRLIGLDQRPINLTRLSTETLSSGFSATLPLGSAGEPLRRGSMLAGITHIWRLGDSLSIRDTLPRLDLLAGDGGGLPRHQLIVRLDGRYGRWGVNAILNWRGPARTRRDFGSDGPDDLRMSGLLTAGLRISTMIDAQGTTEEGARRRHDGLRLEFEVENLLDSRPEARLGDGRPAPGYGRNAQDPLGRTLRLTVSRRF
ncbi:TonB-dependent receptor [uncultured Brevundimonas sp.]|uniref:TonB-dependent receptor n=1 Tax=uncultured Brevundimonas sp. TaxID=213418 RepID=UPI0025F2639E|nr:TonB-dependent receptor [uncultured Brevundimonas sp.]